MTQEMFNAVVKENLSLFKYTPTKFITEKISEKVVKNDARFFQ